MILLGDKLRLLRGTMRIDEPAEEILNYADRRFALKEEIRTIQDDLSSLKESVEQLRKLLLEQKR